jgi:nucleoside-diphosphate-sugar epimerase
MITLITGATGFIGRHTAVRFAARGDRLRVFCRTDANLDPSLRANDRVEVVVGDMRDQAAIERAVKGAARVVHLAAATSGSEEYFQTTTVLGTKHLLAASRAAGVERFLYVSSMSVYDYSRVPDDGVVDEQTPLETQLSLRNDYARAKIMAEAVVRNSMERAELPICIVRPGGVYGPGGKDFVMSCLINVRGRVAILIGGARRQLAALYVQNLVDALALALEREVAIGRIYNLLDENPPSERLYLRTLWQIQHKTMTVVPVPRWPFLLAAHAVQGYRDLRPPTGAMHLVHGFRRVMGRVQFTAAAARRDLGWASRVPLGEAMQLTYGTGECGSTADVLRWQAAGSRIRP